MRALVKALVTICLSSLAILPAAAQAGQKTAADIAGDWQGTLDAGVAKLHLVLHVSKAADGSYSATLDSLDQGANGIPITSISFKDSKLTFASAPIRGTYEGKVNADATLIEGTWSQGQPMALNLRRAVKPSDIDGAWLGTLEAGGAKLRLVFHITSTPAGLNATLDSLDQGALAMPASSIVREGQKVRIELKQVNGVFSGTLDKDLTTIEGTWTQGAPLPLVLKKASDKDLAKELAPRKRPQDPVKPYPYREVEVSYENKSATGVTLAATLTLPQGTGPFPAVLLITGSGAQDRNEEVFGHRPFLVLADYLTRHGFAVLRADDRGFAKSTGNFASATTADFATDAEAGIVFLKSRPEINPRKIGLVGHSEGGLIAPMVAARNPDVAFVVMMAGPGVPGDQIIPEQTRLITEAGGGTHEAAEKATTQQRELLALVRQDKGGDNAALEKKLREKLGAEVTEGQAGATLQRLNSPWMRYFLAYDPAPALRKIKCPVLVINGEKDLQVPPAQNLPAIRKALEEGGNKHFEVVEMPGLNHLFQTAKTGSPNEYAQIEETVAPAALEKIAAWLAKQ
ncbi:MAG TPA: alpha/beta fold hydrolase [Candidatus Angelobacter sp.]